MSDQTETAYDIVDCRCTHPRCHRADTGSVYRMAGACRNCGTRPLIGLFTAGHEASGGVSGGTCPACGCERLHWDRLAGPDEVAPRSVTTTEGTQP